MAKTPSTGLGRRVPSDFKHVEKYPLRALAPQIPLSVEKELKLPWWHKSHDQGQEGACVGFGTSMMMAVVNGQQRRVVGQRPYAVRYDPWWLWDNAKLADEWPDTNPGDDNGTTVRAACQVLQAQGLVKNRWPGHQRKHVIGSGTPDLNEGINTYRWATEVDQMRACIANGDAVSIGVNWYDNFDNPEQGARGGYWIGRDSHLGNIRGGHCVCVYGASDKRQAFKIKNSWGRSYPTVWIPYPTMSRLLQEDGEACVITDR